VGFSTLSVRNLSTRAAGHTILIVRVSRSAGILPAAPEMHQKARSRRDAGATKTIEPLEFF